LYLHIQSFFRSLPKITLIYSLAIILPSYNPPKGWIDRVIAEFNGLVADLPNEKIALYIVNDGSAEKIADTEFADSAIFILNRNQNRGKGFTLREGVNMTAADKIIYTDIDFPYQRASFLAVYNALASADLAIGVRAEDYYHHMPKIRVWVSKSFRVMIRFMLNIPTDDTQCGLKGFNTKGKSVFLCTTIDRYLFDLEFVFLAAKRKLNIVKVPVTLREGVVLSKLNMRILATEALNFLGLFVRSIFS